MMTLLDRALRRLREVQFNRAARAVLATPPCRVDPDDGLVIFSMIGTRVLLPYLVAAKSFQSRLGRGRFAILDDGTLTPADKAVLAYHLGNPPITTLASVDTGPCPRGGTWERLLSILDLRRADYVIQVDSDTVTLGPVPEVAEAIAAGRSFTLRGEATSQILPLAEGATKARATRPSGRAHVQTAIECVMDQVTISGWADLCYVRGCSGFAGFAPAPSGRALAEAFSVEAERLLGRPYWSEWGSEQVTSNFVFANEPDPLLLPYDRYINFWNEPVGGDVAFVHFVGTYRFHRGAYLQAARAAIAALL